jgi:uncharacterized RDD family membrane protein YckC
MSAQAVPRDGSPVTYELASWGVRAAAYLIDALVFVAIGVVIALGVTIAEGGDTAEARRLAQTLALAVGVPLGLAYAPLLLMRSGERNGQTLGKQAMGIRVVRENGQPVTLSNGIMREVIGRQLLVAFTYGLYAVVDYLWPLWDKPRQCLHDKVAQTRVVRLEPTAGWSGGTFTAAGDAGAQAPAPLTPGGLPPAPPPPPPRPDVPVRGGWLPPSAER